MTQSNENTGELGFNVQFDTVGEDVVQDLGVSGFNDHGVRVNRRDDGDIESIDVMYRAMEPGVRKGLEVTPDFLRRTLSYDYGVLPFQMDHSMSQRANVGRIDGANLFYRNGALGLIGTIPNTGSDVRSDVIADFTHEPPAITDGSISFRRKSVELEESNVDGARARFVDGKIKEFSLTPFPGGYDNGGLSPAFSEAVEKAVPEFDAEESADEAPDRTHERRYFRQNHFKTNYL